MATERPNILIVMSDQHSKDVLGCYGNALVRTPNLDRLAREGMRFTNTYCPATLCAPSRMSFLTSRTPSQNRVWDNSHILSSAIPCWAHYVGAAGYETTLIGRMHINGPDRHRGFDRLLASPDDLAQRYRAWTRVPVEGCYCHRQSVLTAGTGVSYHQVFDEHVTAAAVDYLEAKGREAGNRPFAAVASMVLPHNPYVAPKELFDYYMERVDVPAVEPNLPASVRRIRARRGLDDPEIPHERKRLARAGYFALCEQFDRFFGQILDALDRTGLARNTLVIYTSDHGEMAGVHGLWCKSCYYEGAASVPLLARLPGVIEANSLCHAVCNLMDLGPTAVDVAGAEPMREVSGRSLWPWLRGRPVPGWADETFVELADPKWWPRNKNGGKDPYYPSRMIRSGPWKLWYHGDEDHLPPALFNLDDDPQELNDLGSTPRHVEVRDRLLANLMSGWDPEEVRRSAMAQTLDQAVLRKYDRSRAKLKPADLPEADRDVVLL